MELLIDTWSQQLLEYSNIVYFIINLQHQSKQTMSSNYHLFVLLFMCDLCQNKTFSGLFVELVMEDTSEGCLIGSLNTNKEMEGHKKMLKLKMISKVRCVYR